MLLIVFGLIVHSVHECEKLVFIYSKSHHYYICLTNVDQDIESKADTFRNNEAGSSPNFHSYCLTPLRPHSILRMWESRIQKFWCLVSLPPTPHITTCPFSFTSFSLKHCFYSSVCSATCLLLLPMESLSRRGWGEHVGMGRRGWHRETGKAASQGQTGSWLLALSLCLLCVSCISDRNVMPPSDNKVLPPPTQSPPNLMPGLWRWSSHRWKKTDATSYSAGWYRAQQWPSTQPVPTEGGTLLSLPLPK